MNTQVFGCPSCQQPFRVSAEFAGQAVQCPACAQAVEIPKNAFATQTPAPSSVPALPSEQEVFACPTCKGQFGITSAMYGQTVGCPHCQTGVVIKPPEPEPEQETMAPDIVSAPISKIRRSRKAKADLFAPGFESKPVEQAGESQPKKTETSSEEKTSPQPSLQPRKSDSRFREPTKLGRPERPDPSQIHPKRREEKAKPNPQRTGEPPQLPGKPPVASAPNTNARSTPDAQAAEPNAVTRPDVEPINKSTAVHFPKDKPPIQTSAPAGTATEPNRASQDSAIPDTNSDGEIEESPWKPDPIDHLLPPRFDVLDPTRNSQAGQDQFKVVLPDGKGGMAQLDNRVLRVEHDGEKVALRMLTDKQKQRRRLIQNVVAILIGIAVLAITFSLLLRN